ncbi:hypothetical protein F4805DRAFT_365804 [Annulohypoxylon moriforme]|nr:hypothetical protein F4805DRAFT_365804 [Annulohypoxylon moriforme]
MASNSRSLVMDAHHQSQHKELSLGVENEYQNNVNDRNIPVSIRVGLRNGQQPCVDKCYNQFVEEWYGKTHGGFEGVCKQLAQVATNADLLRLYCCDSTNCGVATEVKGQSRSFSLMGTTF